MDIKTILAKVAKGEELTDDEKTAAKNYDPDKERNDAAAAARRKAQEEAETAKTEAEKLKKQLEEAKKVSDDAKKSQMTEAQRKDAELADMKKNIEALTKAKQDAEQKAAAAQRTQTVRDAAKAAGIVLAPKTVSESLFFAMLDATLASVDISDSVALTTALSKFKAENPGIILVDGSGSGVNAGDPAGGSKSVKNPWAKESFNLTEQVKILQSSPDKARALAAEAGQKI